MSKTPTIAELQNLPANELIEQVGSLPADRATALRELEAADKEGGRKTVLAAIDKRLAELAGEGGNAQAAPQPPTAAARRSTAAPAASTGDAPAWQARDYDGPLTIPQAAWRRENIKPAQEPRTK